MVQIRVGSEPIEVRLGDNPIEVHLGENTARIEDMLEAAEALYAQTVALVEFYSTVLRETDGAEPFKTNGQGLVGAEVSIQDADGNTPAGIEADTGALFGHTVKALGGGLVSELLTMGLNTLAYQDMNYDFAIADEDGNVVVGLLDGEWLTADNPGETGDSDSALNMVTPPHLFFDKSATLPLYVDTLLRERDSSADVILTLSSIKSAAARAYFASSFAQIDVDANRIGTSGILTMRRAGSGDLFYTESVTLHAGAATGTGTKRALFVGDSKTNRNLPQYTDLKLDALGYTFSTVGTMQNGASGAANGEGREGMEAADFTFALTTFFTGSDAGVKGAGSNGTVAAGNEAAYTALSEANKLLYNPFLRPSTGGDNPAHVNNGYILDFANYFTRFSLTVPDIGVFGIGTNDDLQNAGDGVSQIEAALEIIYARWRADYATKPLLFWFGGAPRGSTGDDIWNNGGANDHGAVVQALIDFTQSKRTGGDANVWFCGAYAHMSPLAGWATTTLNTDAETGTTEVQISDSVHPGNAAYQCADALCAAIHCILTGA